MSANSHNDIDRFLDPFKSAQALCLIACRAKINPPISSNFVLGIYPPPSLPRALALKGVGKLEALADLPNP